MSEALSLVRLPVGLALGVAERTLGLAAGAVGLARDVVTGGDDGPPTGTAGESTHTGNGAPPRDWAAEAVAEAPAPDPGAVAESRRVVAEPPPEARPAPEPPPLADEIKTLDDEPELVGEFAERGAEEGAGAEVHADEPWEGYDEMTAPEIRRRLQTADDAQLLAVRLHEAGGKGRTSVLNEVAKRLG